MDLRLSPEDQAALDAALRAILSPLAYEHVNAWRKAVSRSIKRLLGADMAMFGMPLGGAAPTYFSEEHPIDELQRYPSYFDTLHRPYGTLEKQLRLGVCTREMLWHPYLRQYYRSVYYNEMVVPFRAYDALMLTVAPAGCQDPEEAAGLIFHHESLHSRSFGERGLALLRLVHAPFKAGVQHQLRFSAYQATFTRTLDALNEGMLLCDLAGRRLHQNPALTRLLERDPEHEHLLIQMAKAARALVRIEAGTGDLPGELVYEPVSRTVRTGTARYRIRGSYLSEPGAASEHYVLVSLEPVVPKLPSVATLRARFGLTRQQARVALLLAERKTNREIAEALFVSVHTVRRHVEQVLAKLEVASRNDVRRILRAA